MNEPTVYILMRIDLNISRGKMCSQAGHAITLVMNAASKQDLLEWCDPEKGNMKKIVLAVSDIDGLDVIDKFPGKGFIVYDAGATEIGGGTATCAGIGIVDKSDPYTKKHLSGFEPLR